MPCLAYVGPESFLSLASVAAAGLGAAMLVGSRGARMLYGLAWTLMRRLLGR